MRQWRRAHSPKVEVREATEEEWNSLARLRGHEHLQGADPAAMTPFVAVVGGRVIGSVALVRLADEQGHRDHWLYALLIDDPRWRGLGIGELLTRAVLDRARTEGADRVCLYVAARNAVALRLYQKLGFGPVIVPPLTAHDVGASYLLLGCCGVAEAENAPGGAPAKR